MVHVVDTTIEIEAVAAQEVALAPIMLVAPLVGFGQNIIEKLLKRDRVPIDLPAMKPADGTIEAGLRRIGLVAHAFFHNTVQKPADDTGHRIPHNDERLVVAATVNRSLRSRDALPRAKPVFTRRLGGSVEALPERMVRGEKRAHVGAGILGDSQEQQPVFVRYPEVHIASWFAFENPAELFFHGAITFESAV
ncbi:MAG: hypothetical protein WBL23_04495 [Salinisphaera sp.]